MKNSSLMPFVALWILAPIAMAEIDFEVSHAQMRELDLGEEALAAQPDWQVPEAMAGSRDESIRVQRRLRTLDGGYTMAAIYTWKENKWVVSEWRLAHPSVADEWPAEQVLEGAD